MKYIYIGGVVHKLLCVLAPSEKVKIISESRWESLSQEVMTSHSVIV